MIQFSPAHYEPALEALLDTVQGEKRCFRDALRMSLDIMGDERGEFAAQKMLLTMLRVPGIADRIEQALQPCSSAGPVVRYSQDATAAPPESARPSDGAGTLISLQMRMEEAQHALLCAEMIDGRHRQAVETERCRRKVEQLGRLIAEAEAALA